jgi:two-component system response regulator YesN
MYKLLIVDDEFREREGLKQLIGWDKLGFQIFDAVESAEKALEIIQNNEINVVITDIIMNKMNGLELIDKIVNINSDIKTVILSGYGEFQYAQMAIKLGAFDYLTKPVDFEDLNRIFTEIKIVLDKEVKLKNQQKEYLVMERERFLNNLVKGIFQEETVIRKKLKDIHLNMEFDMFCVIRIYITNMFGIKVTQEEYVDYLSLKMEIINFLKEYIKRLGKNYVFNNDLNEIAVVFCPTKQEQIEIMLEKLKDDITLNYNCRAFIGVGKEYKNILQAKDSYEEAEKALQYRILKKDSSVLYYKEIETFFKGQSLINDEVMSSIFSYMLQADEKKLVQYVDKILNDAYDIEKTRVNILYETCIEIFLTINKYVSSITGSAKNISGNNQMTIRNLLEKDSIESMMKFINSYIKESIDFVKNSKENASGLIIENAKKYIHEHSSEDITLSKLSEILYIHPNYLSKLFKKKTGENFINYLSKERIETAKRLLKDVSLKIYDISAMTGFCNSKYFGIIFKEIVGVTPSEFRDSIK